MAINHAQASSPRCCTPTSGPSSRNDLTGSRLLKWWKDTDKPLATIFTLLMLLAVLWPAQLQQSLTFTLDALLNIAPWILASVVLAAYAQASQADRLIALRANGHPLRTVALAAVLGVLAPFCSCGVVPLIAGMLAAGVPLAPVMAFWISSPLMDPTMFMMTAANLGLEFAVVKTAAAVVMAVYAGLATHYLSRRGFVSAPLRSMPASSCCASKSANASRVTWRVWETATTRQLFTKSVVDGIWFLARWMTLAFLIESVMVSKLPAEAVTAWLGSGIDAIPLAVAVGIPSYLNGYAALPLVGGLMSLGMNPAVALAFLVAGGVTSVPAMAAVWGLVKPRAFALYLGLALTGALAVSFGYLAFLSS